ncbi:hypothetical protein SCLCIDRAFT_1213166 [Scleroderma citrinum Foug A]|uniref:DUF6534 domain-containing protein n=1 Tax=Scleroderma citrinum Foug A TaxID=1036808 RepID=A0A0C3DVR6_9AGAM|nr:hypothetical protein SCLCIDRAFT_1213166 [Scleroderma citrinum Foug A]
MGFHYSTWEPFKDHIYLPLTVSMGLAALEDTLMALVLAYYLHDKRAQGSMQMVTRLLAYIIGTGALTSLIAIMELVAILASPNTLLFLSFVLIYAKIYTNSALLSLNLRQYHRNVLHEVVLSDRGMTPNNSTTWMTASC